MPSEAGAPGRSYVFNGRPSAAAGTDVSIEVDAGVGFQSAGHATVEADGTFTDRGRANDDRQLPRGGGDEASPAVQLLVLDRKIAASAGGSGRAVTSARASPRPRRGRPSSCSCGCPALRLVAGGPREARTARPVARFSLRLAHRYPARVVLTLRDGATALAVSRTLHIGPR